MLIYDGIHLGSFSFISSYLDGRVYKIGLKGEVISRYEGFKNPLSLSSHGEEVYLLDVGALCLYKYLREEDRWVREKFPLEVSCPYWIDFNGDRMVVVDKDKRGILNFKMASFSSSFMDLSPRVFDMPCAIKLYEGGAFILADGERTLLSVSCEGEPLYLWRLPSSPLSWTLFNGSPYLLHEGFLLTVQGGRLLKKSIKRDFKVILKAGSLLLWDGRSLEEVDLEGWEKLENHIEDDKLILLKVNDDERMKSFKNLVGSLFAEVRKHDLSLEGVLSRFSERLDEETLLKLNSRVLSLELDFKRIYPNILHFLGSLKEDLLEFFLPELLKLFKLSLVLDRLWLLPWEIYWKIPYAEREVFIAKLRQHLGEINVDWERALRCLRFSLLKMGEALRKALNQDHREDALRSFGFWRWINALSLRGLILSGKGDILVGWLKELIDWKRKENLMVYAEKPDLRGNIGALLSNVTSLNLFWLSLFEDIKNSLSRFILGDGAFKKVEGLFYGSYALMEEGSLFVSDWGEGILYRLSPKLKPLWRVEGLLGVNSILLKENKLYLSSGLLNQVFVLEAETGSLMERIPLPDGAKGIKLFMGKEGEIFCSYSLWGKSFLRSLTTNQDLFYSDSAFTYLSPHDTFLLFFPGSIRSYVPQRLNALFDPRLLTFKDWVYKDGVYLGNAPWLGEIKSFRLNGNVIEDVKTLCDDKIFTAIPLSFEGDKVTLFYPWGHLVELKVD